MLEQLTTEFLQKMIESEEEFDFDGKDLHFSVFTNDKNQTIVQLLQRETSVTIVSLVLFSVCLKPYKIYKAWNIESLFTGNFSERIVSAILTYLQVES
jgi:branched-subunit amino acid transport protein AzlD